MSFFWISQERLKREQDEKEYKKKEKAEAHLYTVIKVHTYSMSFSSFFVAVHLNT